MMRLSSILGGLAGALVLVASPVTGAATPLQSTSPTSQPSAGSTAWASLARANPGGETGGAATGPRSTPRITAELVPMSRWATPGSTAIVAIRQDIEPGWHTYWRNPGDSGGATTLSWSLPGEVEAGEIIWPTPERQRLQSLMNFGYSGQVFLPVPIDIPAGARAGDVLALRATALFMVCSDQMCVPDELVLGLDLTVGDGTPPLEATHGAAIQSALTSAPGPGDFEARITPGGDGRLTLSVAGAGLAKARQAWFFPFVGGQVDHPSAQPGERGPQGLSLSLAPGGVLRLAQPTAPVEGLLWTDVGAWEISAVPGEALAGTTGGGDLADPDAGATASLGLPTALLFALLGGLVLNLMPCVFPVLAMKAAGLAKGAHDPAAARRDGLAFLLGVLSTFALLAGALLTLRAAGQSVGWGFQLQSPPVIAGLALLMLAVGLNLSGLYHVGGGAQALAGVAESKARRLPPGAQSFLTGVLAVVVAAPCTAPFMAVALGLAVTLPAVEAMAIFLALGLGLALPYLIVSLTPAIMRRMPRPGPWMIRLQRWLAVPLYLTALWLAWVFARQTDALALGLLIGAGVALALALWALGRADGPKRPMMVSALALGLTLSGGLAWAAAARPAANGGPSGYEEGVLPGVAWSPEAVAAAQAEGKVVFVNFTADWCLTCKVNERAAIQRRGTAEAFQRYDAVYLVGDWTLRDAPIARELERHGRSGVPLYLLYGPDDDEPRVLPQILTPGAVTSALTEAREGSLS